MSLLCCVFLYNNITYLPVTCDVIILQSNCVINNRILELLWFLVFCLLCKQANRQSSNIYNLNIVLYLQCCVVLFTNFQLHIAYLIPASVYRWLLFINKNSSFTVQDCLLCDYLLFLSWFEGKYFSIFFSSLYLLIEIFWEPNLFYIGTYLNFEIYFWIK